MDFKEVVAKRRSIRKYIDKPISKAVVERLLDTALAAPSARNTRSTKFMVIENRDVIAKLALMRDSGSAFMVSAPLVIIVLGEIGKSDLWRENAAISATVLQLACVDEGLGSCWVHINGRPRKKEAPQAETAMDWVRSFIAIPDGCEALCAVSIGYSDFSPADLPPFDKTEKIIW